MNNSPSHELESEQLELIKALAQANENVPAEERSTIRGIRGDGVLNLFHPGFSGGRLVPNDYDLQQLDSLGLISAYDRGGRKGWIVEVLPAGKQYLALLNDGTRGTAREETIASDNAIAITQERESLDPKIEAVQVLTRIIRDVEQGIQTLENVLRRCAKAAHLIGQRESAETFSKEIRGYLGSDDPPFYRRVRGAVQWRTIGYNQLNDPADAAAVIASRLYDNQTCEMVVWSGLDRMREAATDGYWQLSQTVRSRQVPDLNDASTVWVEAVEYYPAQAFHGCLKAIEQVAYDWAVQWLVYLRYESRITDLWQRYRASVDEKIEEINLNNHLKSIDQNLASLNEQDWRNVLYGCRSMLQDVANYLWRDTRDGYPPIQVKGEDGKKRAMRVTGSDYVNRIQAYLHQKSTKSAHTDLIETEAEYLGALFVRLNKLDNHAHAGATRELAESAAIHTYIFLADLVRRTDMQPIERWEP